MSIFDQRGQQVNYQYNAARDVNFDTVRNRAEFVSELEKLKAEVVRAKSDNVIDAEVASDVERHIAKAGQQANQEQPDRNIIVRHINAAKVFVEGVSGAGGLVAALVKAAQLAQQVF